MKSTISLNVLFPSSLPPDDPCIDRLIERLKLRKGVTVVHRKVGTEEKLNQLCIHFDPSVVSPSEIEASAKSIGAQLDKQYGHLILRSKAVHAHRASALEAKLKQIKGVVFAAVVPDGTARIEYDQSKTTTAFVEDDASSVLKVDFNEDGKLAHTCTKTGKANENNHGHDDSHDHSHGAGGNAELVLSIVCGGLLVVGWLLEKFGNLPPSVQLALFIGAYICGGIFPIWEAIEKLRYLRFEIDFLMVIAAIGAAFLGAWAEGALLLFLFSIGCSLEGYAMRRAKASIESLADLTPKVARVRRSGAEEEVPVEELVVGDIVIVTSNERIPSDGFVTSGKSSVNQAPITGESVPVDKEPVIDVPEALKSPDSIDAKHRVYAGTINMSGSLEVQVTRLSSDNTLARVVKMVSEAETRISPTQKFTKQFERYFVPTVISLVILLLFAPLVIDEPFTKSFYRAMAVLVAASPCALAIATPSAVLSGIARAARSGILVKGGEPLESLGALQAIAFDKTGTLTEGKPKVTDIVSLGGNQEKELFRILVSVEKHSEHPLAKAVVQAAESRISESDLSVASGIESVTGKGIKAQIDGQTVYIGKLDLFKDLQGGEGLTEVEQVVKDLESKGRTILITRKGGKYLGVVGLMDTPREAAKNVISKLRSLGITRMIMISGDNQTVASSVAQQVGIDEARGNLMPEDKVKEIASLASAGRGVAMVGDGVNDAPAMANATVGIAMGAAGSEIALETADVALMGDDISQLPLAIGLSRATRSIIRQNLWVSLGMVLFLIPATVLGLNIGPAVVLHEGSTLIVVANALRLLVYRST